MQERRERGPRAGERNTYNLQSKISELSTVISERELALILLMETWSNSEYASDSQHWQ
jgi:hypothetical protein